MRGLGIPLGVTLSVDESCDVDGGSFAIQYKNIGELDTVEFTFNANIFSIAQILPESWIDPIFFESYGMD